MISEEYLNFSTGEKKLLRFTLVTLSAVTLMGLIVFVKNPRRTELLTQRWGS